MSGPLPFISLAVAVFFAAGFTARSQDLDAPIGICGNDIIFEIRRIQAGVFAAVHMEERRFADEMDALIASQLGTAADWDEVFAKWRHQVEVRWPARLKEIERQTIGKHGKALGVTTDLARVVRDSERVANRLYLRSQTKTLMAEPVALLSGDAMLVEGTFSLETPRPLNPDAEHPARNRTQFNRWGAHLQFEGPVLLDRIEFLLAEDFADAALAGEQLLVLIGLEKLDVSVRGRRVTARPAGPLGEVELLDWIDLAWKNREEMLPVSDVAVYGRAADRYPFDLRPAAKTPTEAIDEAALWITSRYGNRLKRRAARYLITHGQLKEGMASSQVTELLGAPTRTIPGQLIYEKEGRPDFGETDDFRLVFTIGPGREVTKIELDD